MRLECDAAQLIVPRPDDAVEHAGARLVFNSEIHVPDAARLSSQISPVIFTACALKNVFRISMYSATVKTLSSKPSGEPGSWDIVAFFVDGATCDDIKNH